MTSPKSKRTLVNMKRLLTIVVFCALAACSHKADTYDSHGNPVSLSDLDGKWLIVSYWAEWCGNCKKELKDLNGFYNIHKDKVILLGVNFDAEPNEKLLQFAKHNAIDFPLSSQFPMEKFGVKHIETLPRTYVFSPDGKLQKTLYGPQNGTQLAKAIGIHV